MTSAPLTPPFGGVIFLRSGRERCILIPIFPPSSNQSSMSQKKRLLAFLVGINDYKYQSHLGAALEDVKRMDSYLATYATGHLIYKPTILRDEEATYHKFIQAFENQIKEAGPEDIFFFYYSGHGGQEKADAVWNGTESDLLLEGLALQDSGTGGAPMMIDKDLRFLINQLAEKGADILTIFDCCHSGDNTRSLNVLPRLSGVAPKRGWQDFYFVQQLQIESDKMKVEGLDTLVPHGRHTHIAACQDFELAYELGDGTTGIFTDKLLEILRETDGNISYLALQRRIKQAIRLGSGGIRQTPQIFVLKKYPKDAYRNWLSNELTARPMLANLTYNASDRAWWLDRGQMHGVEVARDADDHTVLVFAGNNKTVNARITEVKATESKVEWGLDAIALLPPDKSQSLGASLKPLIPASRPDGSDIAAPQTLAEGVALLPESEKDKLLIRLGQEILPGIRSGFSAFVPGLMSHPILVKIEGDPAGTTVLEAFVEAGAAELQRNGIFIAPPDHPGDFRIWAGGGLMMIKEPDNPRPLVEQVKGYTSASAKAVFADLRVAQRWHFAKKLDNPVQALPEKLVKLEIEMEGKSYTPDDKGVIHLQYPTNEEGKLPKTEIGISLTNDTGRSLYFAALYLDPQFGVDPRLLEPEVMKKEAQATFPAFGGRKIPLQMERYIIDHNWPSQIFWIKILGNTAHFDPKLYRQKALKAPFTPNRGATRGGMTARGALDLSFGEEPEVDTWGGQLIEVRVENPYYRAE